MIRPAHRPHRAPPGAAPDLAGAVPPAPAATGAALPAPVWTAAALAAALLASALPCPAEDTGVIVGRVFDRRLVSRLPFAAIMVRSLPPRWGASSDDDGRFRIEGVPGGSWDLEVSAPEYGRVIASVPVAAGETTEVSVALGPPGDTLFGSARFGPRAPFVFSFPRAHKLEGEGLLSFWYSEELPRAIGFSDDGERLVLETKSGVEVFHARGGRLVRDHALPFPTPGPTDVAVGLGRDGFLRLRQSGTASMLEQEVDPRLAQRPVGRIVAAPLAGLYRTAFSADRSRLATWPAGGTSVTVWRLPEGAEVATLPSRVAVQAAGFARDSTLVVLGGSSRSHLLEVWSLPERQLVSAVQGEAGESAVRSLAVDPAGGFLIAGGTDFALSAWALPELAPLWRVEPRACCPGDFLELSPDGSVVVTGSGSGLLFLDARSGRLLKKLTTNHGRGIRAAAFHPDGRSLATVGYDSALALWDVRRILGEAE